MEGGDEEKTSGYCQWYVRLSVDLFRNRSLSVRYGMSVFSTQLMLKKFCAQNDCRADIPTYVLVVRKIMRHSHTFIVEKE